MAIAVGHHLPAEVESVYFFDFGSLNDPHLVPGAVASTLGLLVQSSDATASLITFLRDKRVLLILNSCEHVIDSAAVLAERIFQEAPQVFILVTSRETLRVEGEYPN